MNFSIDIETTGIKPEESRLLSVAIKQYTLEDSKEVLTFYGVVKPDVTIPSHITKINGLTNKDLVNGMTEEVLLRILKSILDNCTELSGWNIKNFDYRFIKVRGAVYGINFDEIKLFDTKEHYRDSVFKYVENSLYKIKAAIWSRRLGDVYRDLTGKEPTNAHNAMYDVEMEQEILRIMTDSNFTDNYELRIVPRRNPDDDSYRLL